MNTPHIPIATRTACARTGEADHSAGAPEPSFSCRGAHGAHDSDERDEQGADEECKEDAKELSPQARAVQAGHHLSRLSCQGDGGGAGRHRRRGPRVQQGDRLEQTGDLPAAAARALDLGEFLLRRVCLSLSTVAGILSILSISPEKPGLFRLFHWFGFLLFVTIWRRRGTDASTCE